MLLGLYEGVPLSRRGTDYGVYPVVPDRITLFQRNIELTVSLPEELRERIREVMVHEIAHHFGMSEKEIRDAGY
jgi:predicted Zn-dependent protease with MMP-like domain